jgi:phosphatidylinositol glycan class B
MPSSLDTLRAEMPGFRLWPFLAAALGVHLIAAWCNGGFLNADEHYQIIEFAQYKLGRQAASGLAWEFAARMRPALQPWIAESAIRLAEAIGIASPFAIAFALRVVSTLLAMWVSLELSVRTLRGLESRMLKIMALFASFFFWLTPTVHSRFSSENWSAALLVAGLCLMLDAADCQRDRSARSVLLAICAGLTWSAAFYCRFQIGASIAGAAVWLLVIRRARVLLILMIAASFAAGCALNEVLDRWLYGVWTFVPYNYFVVNLVQGKAAAFGTTPWWMIPVYFAVVLIPPYSLIVIAVVAAGCWYARRALLVWTIVPFVALHALVGHKEPRFLIPMLYFIGPLVAVSIEAIPFGLRAALVAASRTLVGRVTLLSACAINVLLLCVAIFVPANDTYRLDRWLWEQGRHGALTLYALDGSPGHAPDPVTDTFYASQNVVVSRVRTLGQLRAAAAHGSAFVYYLGFDPPGLVAAAGGCTPILRTFPAWLARLAWFATPLGVHIGTVCRLNGKPPVDRVPVHQLPQS